VDAKLRTAIGRATNLEGGYDDLSPYQVTEVFSLAQIPSSVRKRLFDRLINCLGEGFFLKLRLESGQIVDIAKMHRVNTSRSGTSLKASRCTGHKSACPPPARSYGGCPKRFFDGWTEVKHHYVEIDIYNGQMTRHADVYAIH